MFPVKLFYSQDSSHWQWALITNIALSTFVPGIEKSRNLCINNEIIKSAHHLFGGTAGTMSNKGVSYGIITAFRATISKILGPTQSSASSKSERNVVRATASVDTTINSTVQHKKSLGYTGRCSTDAAHIFHPRVLIICSLCCHHQDEASCLHQYPPDAGNLWLQRSA
jgi:hypothetical protein